MADNPEPKRFKYLNLEISEHGISEFNGDRRVIFIAREDIQGIETHFGSNAERPLLQILFGSLLVALGAAGATMIINGGGRGLRWGAGFFVFGCLGAWMLYEAVHKSHYLLVTTRNDRRKLIIHGRWSQIEFDRFTQNAAGLTYQFTNTRPDNP